MTRVPRSVAEALALGGAREPLADEDAGAPVAGGDDAAVVTGVPVRFPRVGRGPAVRKGGPHRQRDQQERAEDDGQ